MTDESGSGMADAIMTLAGNRDLAVRLGANALRDLYVSWDDMIDSAVKRYTEIIDAVSAEDIRPRKKMPSDIAIDAIADITQKIEQLMQRN